MKQLQSITINNIRRFGANVPIEIGKGATVFLAPNGTGKTAIFQSIEFALTGAVKALENSKKGLEALVRHNEYVASTRLDFEGGKFVETIFNVGGKLERLGDHSILFADRPNEDVPWLLGLTHFLNQHGDSWIVQQGNKEAANQLNFLPIVRDLSIAADKLLSAKVEVTANKKRLDSDMQVAMPLYNKWMSLIEKRKVVGALPSSTMIPTDELLSQLNNFAEIFEAIEVEERSSIAAIRAHLEHILANAKSDLERNKQGLIALESLEPIVASYMTISEEVILTEEKLKISRNNKINLDNTLNLCSQGLQQTKNTIAGVQEFIALLKASRSQHNKMTELVTKRSEIEAKIIDSESLSKAIEEELLEAHAMKEAAQSVEESYIGIEMREVAITTEKANLESLEKLVEQWKKIEIQIHDLQLNRTKLEDLTQAIVLEQEGLEKHLISLKGDLEGGERFLASLKNVTDAVKNAVVSIADNYPKENGDCPVCGTVFDPAELQSRMAISLAEMNPELEIAVNRVSEQRKKVENTTTALNEIKTKLNLARQSENESRTKELQLQKELTESILPKLPGISNSGEAQEFIDRGNNNVNDRQILLQLEKSKLPPRDSEEDKAKFQSRVDIASDRKTRNTLNKADSTSILASLETELEILVAESKELISIEDIDQKLPVQESELEQLSIKKQKLETENEEIQKSQSLANMELEQNESFLTQLLSRQAAYMAQWEEAKLAKPILKENLDKAITAARMQVEKMELIEKELNAIGGEVARHESMKSIIEIEEEISRMKNGTEEKVFENGLKERVDSLRRKRDLAEEFGSALELFGVNLQLQQEEVHEKIMAINPIWSRLLKRVVLEPRFSDTKINSETKNTKQHAGVYVPLRGAQFSASEVASEAQITDLQLTFLLAMSQKYQWSPWRALLLDDPTQHHDLVHASAVFDLLRDYIVDFGYQILLATHDSVQARFFMRKLENDGIPAKLYSLVSTSSGVKAVQEEW